MVTVDEISVKAYSLPWIPSFLNTTSKTL